jgi:hypothetical protein
MVHNTQNYWVLVFYPSFGILKTTNVPVNVALQVIRNKLHNDDTLTERPVLQFEAIMEPLEVCLRATCCQVHDKFFQQKDGICIGSSISPIVSNIYMEHYKKLALDSIKHNPSLWLQNVDDTFVDWPHGPQRLQNLLRHFNNLRLSIQFTMEIESKVRCLSGYSGYQERDDISHQSLYETHPQWPISQFQI